MKKCFVSIIYPDFTINKCVSNTLVDSRLSKHIRIIAYYQAVERMCNIHNNVD